jgi:hypothetical protein
LDTGLVISFAGSDPTLRAMGVQDIDIAVLAATNIDLGPRELWVDILYSMPIVAPIIGFTGITLFVWRRRRKKKIRGEVIIKKKERLERKLRPKDDSS